MLHGIIDIGSNTIRMAIYLIENDQIEMLMKKKHTVGLAAYLEDGVMQPAGIDKAVATLLEFKEFLATFNITKVTAFTTAALRNAKNSREAVAEIEARTGIKIRVISGDEEATFDFIGATHNLPALDGLLIDIGGGSTEIVVYKDRQIVHKTSMPIGSLDFYTRFVKGILPTPAECVAMEQAAKQALAAIPAFANVQEAAIAGIGGTFKGASALYNELFGEPLPNNNLEVAKLPQLITSFQLGKALTQDMTVMMMRSIPERMHTVIPGLIIAKVLADNFHSERITYSDSGVREGYIYDQIIGK